MAPDLGFRKGFDDSIIESCPPVLGWQIDGCCAHRLLCGDRDLICWVSVPVKLCAQALIGTPLLLAALRMTSFYYCFSLWS